MGFVSWLDEYVLPSRKLPESKRVGQTIELEEKDNNANMSVTIGDVPDSAVVIRPDKAGQWRILKSDKRKGWDSLCDYLILWESDDKLFAIFIELKTSTPHPHGKTQLRWTLPMLHYLLFVFDEDSRSATPETEIVAKYFEFGQRKNRRIVKRHTKSVPTPFFRDEVHWGIRVRYSVEQEFSLRQLLRN